MGYFRITNIENYQEIENTKKNLSTNRAQKCFVLKTHKEKRYSRQRKVFGKKSPVRRTISWINT